MFSIGREAYVTSPIQHPLRINNRRERIEFHRGIHRSTNLGVGKRPSRGLKLRTSTMVMIGFAVLFGLLAVFLAQTWLNNQADARLKSIEAQRKAPVPERTIVVAARPLRFGDELTPLRCAKCLGRKTRCRPALSARLPISPRASASCRCRSK